MSDFSEAADIEANTPIAGLLSNQLAEWMDRAQKAEAENEQLRDIGLALANSARTLIKFLPHNSPEQNEAFRVLVPEIDRAEKVLKAKPTSS